MNISQIWQELGIVLKTVDSSIAFLHPLKSSMASTEISFEMIIVHLIEQLR